LPNSSRTKTPGEFCGNELDGRRAGLRNEAAAAVLVARRRGLPRPYPISAPDNTTLYRIGRTVLGRELRPPFRLAG
jgi:hypothetical protein